MTTEREAPPAADNGLRWMLKWVLIVLVATVLFSMTAVVLTVRWLS